MIAAADEGDDLVIVAILDIHAGDGRARHDLHVALDRDPARLEPEVEREVVHGHAGADAAMLAVHGDRNSAVGVHSNS